MGQVVNQDPSIPFIVPTSGTTYIVDLSVIIRMHAAVLMKGKKNSLTYREWVVGILDSIANTAMTVGVDEIGIVTDFYNPISIKSFTRDTRGSQARVMFKIDDTLPDDLMGALTNGTFKTQLNELFCETSVLNSWKWGKDFTMTKGYCIIERVNGTITDDRIIVFSGAAPSLEEADNRILLHIRESISRGRKNIIVRTVDSDVIVILIGFMAEFLKLDDRTTVTVKYGTKLTREISIDGCYHELGD